MIVYLWKNIIIDKRTTHDKISELSFEITDRTNRLREKLSKNEKVLDKTDLIRYNKQAVAENDNETKEP